MVAKRKRTEVMKKGENAMLKGAFIVPHPPLIIPEVGGGRQKTIQRTIDSYKRFAEQIRGLKPDVLVIATPHAAAYADAFVLPAGTEGEGSFADFGAPAVRIRARWDSELIDRIFSLAKKEGLALLTEPAQRGKSLDHALMIPLYFINALGRDIPVVRLSISDLSPQAHRNLGRCIDRAAEELGRSYVFIASADLSHKLSEEGPYGLSSEGVEFDRIIRHAVQQSDVERFFSLDEDFTRKAAECGLRPIQILTGALDGHAFRPEEWSYEAPFGVGYMVAAFHIVRKGDDPYISLAKRSLEHYVRTGRRLSMPEGLSPELTDRRGGAFVTLKIGDQLRGCIGTITPTRDSLAEEIIRNAMSAGTEDPRFLPVREKELSKLEYSVDVLSLPEPAAGEQDLDPLRYGIIVSCGGRKGLLLPDLEGIDTVEKQLAIALQKAGIDSEEPYRIERFDVERHRE
jgi:AmmeMemoRadiSam system protein A